MAKEERRLYPSRHGKDVPRMLALARRAAAVLAPGFDAPRRGTSCMTRTCPFDHSLERVRHGSWQVGLELDTSPMPPALRGATSM
jgi:hypothetical protein